MSELLPFQRPSSGLQRQVRRELTRITVETGLSTARMQAGAEIEAARLAAVAHIGTKAQEELAVLIRQERHLADVVPEAEMALLHMREITQLAMGAVLMDAARKLGRS